MEHWQVLQGTPASKIIITITITQAHIHYHEGNVVHSHDHVHDTGHTDMGASCLLLVWFMGWLEVEHCYCL
jgi:hypothetical protein